MRSELKKIEKQKYPVSKQKLFVWLNIASYLRKRQINFKQVKF